MAYPYALLYSPGTGDSLSAAQYVAEHQNHINSNIPEDMDDFSANVSEMQLQSDPGEVGTESLATSLSEELRRLRFAIKDAKAAFNSNVTYWYETPTAGSIVKTTDVNTALIHADVASFTSTVLTLATDEEDNGSFYFLKCVEDYDTSADVKLSVDQDGNVVSTGNASFVDVTASGNIAGVGITASGDIVGVSVKVSEAAPTLAGEIGYQSTKAVPVVYDGTSVKRIATNTTVAKSADYTVLDDDGVVTILMTTGGTNRVVTLPTAADNAGRVLTFKKVDSGTGYLTIDGENAETINDLATIILFSIGDYVTIQCDGTSWHIIAQRVFEYLHNSNTTTTAGAADTTSFAYGSSGTAFVAVASTTVNSVTTKRVRSQNNINDGDLFFVEIRDTGDTGNKWVSISSSPSRVAPLTYQNTSVYGMDIDRVDDSATDLNVEFGNCGRIPNASTYANTNASAWTDMTTWNWRIKRIVNY